MYFTFRELAAVAMTGAHNYVLDVRKDEGKWIIEVTVVGAGDGQQRTYLCQTNRGKTKTWRYLEDVLVFVNQYAANCQNMAISVQGKVWKLKSEGTANTRDQG
jgi:hypothetical protein